MKLIQGLREVIDDFDVFVLDLWGVLIDGERPFEGVADALRQLRAAGKTCIVLSNSSRPAQATVKRLEQFFGGETKDSVGQNPDQNTSIVDHVVTSGQVALDLLRQHTSFSDDINNKNNGADPTPHWWPALTAASIQNKAAVVLGRCGVLG